MNDLRFKIEMAIFYICLFMFLGGLVYASLGDPVFTITCIGDCWND